MVLALANCGGGNSLKVALSSNSSSSTINATSTTASYTITAAITNDSKNAGANWSMTSSAGSPAGGCGTLTNDTSGSKTATYTLPSAATLNTDCTATILATSVSNSGKSSTLVLTIKAITVGLTGTVSAGTTLNAGDYQTGGGTSTSGITLTANEGNDTTTDNVQWSSASTCGSTVTSTTAPYLTATYTPPPATLASDCTFSVTVSSTTNSKITKTLTYPVKATTLAWVTQASSSTVVEGGSSAAMSAKTVNNGTSDTSVDWSVSPACGTLSSGNSSGSTLTTAASASVVFKPTAPIPSGCSGSNAVTVSVTADADANATPLTQSFTVSPITVGVAASSTTVVAGSGALTLTPTTNDPQGASKLGWSLQTGGCGGTLGTSGASETYTPPISITTQCTDTVIATSATDNTVKGQLTITVNPITVSITSPTGNSSSSPLVLSSGAQTSTITVSTNDPAGTSTLSWALSNTTGCGTGTGAGGSLSSTTGALSTYTTQATLPQSATTCAPQVTVNSKTDSSKTATVYLSVTPAAVTVALISPTSPTNASYGSTTAIPITASITNDVNTQSGFSAPTLTPTTGCGTLSRSLAAVSTSSTGVTTYGGLSYTPPSNSSSCSGNTASLALLSAFNNQQATLTINLTNQPVATLSPDGTNSIDANLPGGSLSITPTVTGVTQVNMSTDVSTCGTLAYTNPVASGTVLKFTPSSTLTSSCTVKITATPTTTPSQSDTLTLTVYPALALPTGTPSSLNSPTVAGISSYSGSITASGGSGSYSGWSVSFTSGADGLTTNASGNTSNTVILSGPATSATTVPFTVTVTDSTGNSVSQSYNLVVSTYTAVGLPSSLSPSTATVGSSFTTVVNATNGVQTYQFTVNSTSIPTDGTLTEIGTSWLYGQNSGGNSLRLTGTPASTDVGSLSVSVQVVDGEGKSAITTTPYSISVNAASALAVSLSNIQIYQGMVNMPYGLDLSSTASGGTTPYTFSVTGLPDGLSGTAFNNNPTGSYVTGTPTTTNSSTASSPIISKVTVTDDSKASQSATFVLPVVAEPDGKLNTRIYGQYACMIHQERDSSTANNLRRSAVLFAIKTDGKGGISDGEIDMNSSSDGYNYFASSLSGSYALGSDQRGYLKVNCSTCGGGVILAMAAGVLDSSNYYSQLRITAMDDVGDPEGTGSAGQHGGGICYRQYNYGTATTLDGQTLSGGYVFAMNGESSSGDLANMVGSINVTKSTGAVTGVADTLNNTTSAANGPTSLTASVAAADSFGRVLFTCVSGCSDSVLYITNQTQGEGVIMTTGAHNTPSELYFGQIRSQNLTDIAGTSYPLSGPWVMYATGAADASGNYKALIAHGTGSTSSPASFTMDAQAKYNQANTAGLVLNDTSDIGTAMDYTFDKTTGRLVVTGKTGVAFYLYDTNQAAALFGDTKSGVPENMLGWLQKQTVPSGNFTVSSMATTYYMGDMYRGDYNSSNQTGTFTVVASDGTMSGFAQDEGGNGYASWQGGFGGPGASDYTGALALDKTDFSNYDTAGTFEVNVTASGSSTAVPRVYCFATNSHSSTTKGRLICLDSTSPKISIVQE